MQAMEWRVRRLDSGALDHDFYRAEVARQPAVCAALGGAIVRQIHRLVAFLQASGQVQANIVRNHPHRLL
jgi:hypothetical protein